MTICTSGQVSVNVCREALQTFERSPDTHLRWMRCWNAELQRGLQVSKIQQLLIVVYCRQMKFCLQSLLNKNHPLFKSTLLLLTDLCTVQVVQAFGQCAVTCWHASQICHLIWKDCQGHHCMLGIKDLACVIDPYNGRWLGGRWARAMCP